MISKQLSRKTRTKRQLNTLGESLQMVYSSPSLSSRSAEFGFNTYNESDCEYDTAPEQTTSHFTK
jgi:hypothetical protein